MKKAASRSAAPSAPERPAGRLPTATASSKGGQKTERETRLPTATALQLGTSLAGRFPRVNLVAPPPPFPGTDIFARGAHLSPPRTSRALGWATQGHARDRDARAALGSPRGSEAARDRDSRAAIGNPQDKRHIRQSCSGRSARAFRGCAWQPPGQRGSFGKPIQGGWPGTQCGPSPAASNGRKHTRGLRSRSLPLARAAYSAPLLGGRLPPLRRRLAGGRPL
jgi:hypothetical protein